MHASWSSLYRTAYLLLGDHAEAEDLVQSALAKTYASWHRVRDLNAASGYARTTMVNTAVVVVPPTVVAQRATPPTSLPEQAHDHDPPTGRC